MTDVTAFLADYWWAALLVGLFGFMLLSAFEGSEENRV
jgi:ABC-type uncharacterized transport system auxiliary subunit